MRLGDLDGLRDEVCERFNLPMVIGEMDNPDEREAITVLNMITSARTIIPGRDDVDPMQCFVIGDKLPPQEIIRLLRSQAKRRPRHIGRKPQVLYDQAADCIERLLRDHDDD